MLHSGRSFRVAPRFALRDGLRQSGRLRLLSGPRPDGLGSIIAPLWGAHRFSSFYRGLPHPGQAVSPFGVGYGKETVCEI
jgi:hypothetical protein